MGLEKISGTPFYHLSRLEHLDLSHNRLTEIKDLFQFEVHPNKLKNLSLAYNAIEELPSYVFDELSSLTELDLSYNLISDLTEEPFFNLTNLRVLRLNNNRIKDLNGAVNNLKDLKHLYVRGNMIQNIDDESLKIIEHLITFDVSSNELEQIKPIMFLRHWAHFGNHSICKIILSQNHIYHIPNGTAEEISSRYIGDLDKRSVDIYTELDLSMNSITTVEYNAFQSLIRITDLNLSQNKLIDFLVNANDLAHITCLNLSSNYISQLYFETFSLMNNLQHLDLSYNRVELIPDTALFSNNYQLKVLNMTYNVIKSLDTIHVKVFHSDGGVLDLSNNGLMKLSVPYGEGLRLITLYLHSNNITNATLIDLSEQRDLQTLDLSKNFISVLDISSLRLPLSLVTLDLGSNRIRQIGPSTFHRLVKLKTLRLNNNHLSQLEYGSFQGLLALRSLDLSYNTIRYLDSKMLTDLKSLRDLSVRSNDMEYLDYKAWYGHRYDLLIYIDNNELTCEWLSKALSDLNNGYSRMRPTVLVNTRTENSVEGIPCKTDVSASIVDAGTHYVMADERLLVLTQNILRGVHEQNYYLRQLMLRVLKDKNDKRDNEVF